MEMEMKNNIFYIKSQDTSLGNLGKYLVGKGQSDEVKSVEFTENNKYLQWKFIKLSSNVYNIQNVGSGLNLDANGHTNHTGTRIITWTPHELDNQKLTVEKVKDDNYHITFVHSGKAVDTYHGGEVHMWDCHQGPNQLWNIVAVTPQESLLEAAKKENNTEVIKFLEEYENKKRENCSKFTFTYDITKIDEKTLQWLDNYLKTPGTNYPIKDDRVTREFNMFKEKGFDKKWLLHTACVIGDCDTIKKLIKEEKYDPNQKMCQWNDSAIACATNFGQLEATIELIKLGANPFHYPNTAGETPLSDAERENRTETVKFLNEYRDFLKGDHKTYKNDEELQKLNKNFNYQKEKINDDVKNWFKRENWTDEWAIMSASYYGDLETIKKLIEINKIDPNVQMPPHVDSEPLGWAASGGCLEAVQLLISLGADPMRPANKSGYTPLGDAEREGHKDIIQYLKKYEEIATRDQYKFKFYEGKNHKKGKKKGGDEEGGEEE